MITKSLTDLAESIANNTQDYKGGRYANSHHVLRWVNQFESNKRLVILHEIDHIIKNCYISKEIAVDYLRDIFNIKNIIGGNFEDCFHNISFLNIQQKGNSQNELLNLLDDVLQNDYNLSLDQCGKLPTKYIYIDDCFFSGNTVKWDIAEWVKNPCHNSELHLVFFTMYTRDLKYIQDEINKLVAPYNIRVFYWSRKTLHNKRDFDNRTFNNQYDCFWAPMGNYDKLSLSYINDTISQRSNNANEYFPLLRDSSLPVNETFFTSRLNREIVEREFFEKGVFIKSFGLQRNEKIRPLGYDNIGSLGFGSIFITYRNIANNCPLVLWWGNPYSHSGINQWYPLFPRTVNE